jgi:hypothetical protein
MEAVFLEKTIEPIVLILPMKPRKSFPGFIGRIGCIGEM